MTVDCRKNKEKDLKLAYSARLKLPHIDSHDLKTLSVNQHVEETPVSQLQKPCIAL